MNVNAAHDSKHALFYNKALKIEIYFLNKEREFQIQSMTCPFYKFFSATVNFRMYEYLSVLNCFLQLFIIKINNG